MHDRFTTPTGTTGRDAYIYEAAQIANAQRELDARMARLRTAIAREVPASETASITLHDDGSGPLLPVSIVRYASATLARDIERLIALLLSWDPDARWDWRSTGNPDVTIS